MLLQKNVFVKAVFLLAVLAVPLVASEDEENEIVFPESDEEVYQMYEQAKSEFEQARAEYKKAEKAYLDLLNKKLGPDKKLRLSITEEQLEKAKKEKTAKARVMKPIGRRYNEIKREYERRKNMPEYEKKFQEVEEIRREYSKGKGTREEMAKLYRDYVKEFPESSKADYALLHAAILYTSGVFRDDHNNPEPTDYQKARIYYQQIVDRDPNLISLPSVFAREDLACTYRNVNKIFNGRVELLHWLDSIDANDYEYSINKLENSYRYRNKSRKHIERQLRGLIRGAREVTEKNIVWDAAGSDDPVGNLDFLIREFPDSNLPALARERLGKLIDENELEEIQREPMEP